MKKIYLTIMVVLTFFIFSNLIADLGTGDIYFVGWNADGNDDIVFLTFVDIDAGTKIYFRDDEYNNGWIDENEGCISWTCPAGGIYAGNVIQIYDCASNPPTASSGTCIREDATFNISVSEDAVYAYISTVGWNSGICTFLAAFCNQTSFSNYLNGTGLTDGTDAWSWDDKDNWRYKGSRNGSTVSEVKSWIQNFNNWEYTDGSGDQSFTFNLDDFTLPVILSTFTAQYLNNIPTLYWITQSETDNIGWYVYRNTQNDFITSMIISDLISGYGTTSETHSYIYEDYIENVFPGDTYWYWLESIDLGGMINHYDKVAYIVIPENYDPGNENPEEFEEFGLFQSNPNPFNPKTEEATEISFNLKEQAYVEINIYNIKGELIKTIYNDFASTDNAVWDGKDENGNLQATGIYFYELKVNNKVYSTKRIILIK